ncbi:hypothetical protein [Actinophytocola oryzae]|uniref:Uncharacterized protein n=1 Tax=Actinophytocola oryzae TaxID=502181 RepID=A0A4V3FTN2_9PSEU|nr:hypothetical protein [Actinophytocola oryzae]TDV51981.1 hypothetical protein CLV71_105110 [Actinophytocola oryzae]
MLAAALVLTACVQRSAVPADEKPVSLDSQTNVRDEVDPCSLTGQAAYEPHGPKARDLAAAAWELLPAV